MTKDDILSAGIKIIETEGFDRLTLSSLASELGVKKPSIYHYFASKDEIISELYVRARKLLRKHTFRVDFTLSAEEVLTAVYLHWEALWRDEEIGPYLSLLSQRESIDEEAYEILASLNLMTEAQSDAVIDNLVMRKKLVCEDKKFLSFLFSSAAMAALKKEERDLTFIKSFVSVFSH